MQQQVLPPDVDNEGHPRMERRDVGEVLVGADAEIDAAGDIRSLSVGMTCWNAVSFETRLSERKKPPGSEKSTTSFQNARSRQLARQFARRDFDPRPEPHGADEREQGEAEEEAPPTTDEPSTHRKGQYTLVIR